MMLDIESLKLDRSSQASLQKQLFQMLRQGVLSADLPADSKLPSSRTLAKSLGVGRNTVIAVYDQLIAEGYLISRVGSGTQVSQSVSGVQLKSKAINAGDSPKLSTRGMRMTSTSRLKHSGAQASFQVGLPALDEFPYAKWSRFVARNYRSGAKELFGYDGSGGLPRLRTAIAKYVRTQRGVVCDDSQVIVISGSQAAIDLSARMLIDPGDDVWIENPCYQGARAALLGAGANLCPVPVGASGLDVDYASCQFPAAKLAFVTPSYQYPLGITMSLEQRLRLLDWAENSGSWIIEDDYDSEFRYHGHSISALQGLDSGERVLYMGTYSKTMFPSIRIAYLIVPYALVDVFHNALRQSGQSAPLPLQGAMADFINEGAYVHHVRRMKAIYMQRQQHFLELADYHLKDTIEFGPADAGMHLIGYFLDQSQDDNAVTQRAAELGLIAPSLSGLYMTKLVKRGLYLGYAGLARPAMERAFAQLATAIKP
ncbi:MAG: GntR family transcriptional regulator/MocR family aminotransferase [Gammaproteobacteria bacterium]|jgi:GntR family transcriptional regulator/MocR family aminotransferase